MGGRDKASMEGGNPFLLYYNGFNLYCPYLPICLSYSYYPCLDVEPFFLTRFQVLDKKDIDKSKIMAEEHTHPGSEKDRKNGIRENQEEQKFRI